MKSEYKEIKKQFDKVIAYSQDIYNPLTEELFEEWEKNKQWFIEKFNNQLIYEFPDIINFELDEHTKENKLKDFYYWIEEVWHNTSLATYIKVQEKGFFANEVVSDFTIDDKIIKKGTKLIKTFKYFVSGRALESIQNEASRIIQENKVEGKLCISVHPLDYLSMSENCYNWRSCHALDGEFRAGNLSYMVDDSTVICYIKGKDDVVLPHFPHDVPWNNKKWRMIMYFSKDKKMIFAGRPYPFSLQSAANYILENFIRKFLSVEKREAWWGNVAEPTTWCEWTDTKLKSLTMGKDNIIYNSDYIYIPLGNGLIRLGELMQDNPGTYHFNDVLSSSCYDPIFTCQHFDWDDKKYAITSMEHTKFAIGGKVKCLSCGQNSIYEDGDTMVCYSCYDGDRDVYYCDCCGYGSSYEDDFYWVDGETFCDSCYDRYCGECELCGDIMRKEELTYDEEHEKFYCKTCLNKIERDREVDE